MEKGKDAWNNNILVAIDTLETTMARNQFIMILNILDTQLEGIDEVSKLIVTLSSLSFILLFLTNTSLLQQEDKLRKEEEAEQDAEQREIRLNPSEKGKEKLTTPVETKEKKPDTKSTETVALLL